jgi:carbon monoxide dehydrogenase subunit G
MQRFEGERDFSQPPHEVFARLTDVSFLVGCIPDVETVKAVEADRAELVLRPGFAFVRGTLEVTLRIVEKAEPTSARVQLLSRGIGSSSEVEATLAVGAHDGGTRVHWAAEVKSLGGLLKMVPAGLIRGAAEKVINDAWSRIAEKMA